jgi:hypothetical protein
MSESMTQSPELEALQARRRHLAFEVGQGREELEPELDAAEEQIARLARSQERAALARQQGAVRSAAEAREQEAKERAELEEKFSRLLVRRLKAAGKVEAAMTELEAAITASAWRGPPRG